MGGVLEAVNRTKIPCKLLAEVFWMNAVMAAAGCDVLEARLFRIFELLERKDPGVNRIPAMAMAIDLRLTALARLAQDAALQVWLKQHRGLDHIAISEEMLKAAALEPLIESPEGLAVFDAEQFRQRVLANIEPDGHA